MFSDESRFSLCGEFQVLITIKPISLNDTMMVLQYCMFGVELWWATEQIFMFKLELIKSHIYWDILRKIGMFVYGCCGHKIGVYVWQCPSSTCKHHGQMLSILGYHHMEWPTLSPDSNPLKYVWNAWSRSFSPYQPPPKRVLKLHRAFLAKWINVPQDQLDNSILSLPRRCTGCISSSLWGIQHIYHHSIC